MMSSIYGEEQKVHRIHFDNLSTTSTRSGRIQDFYCSGNVVDSDMGAICMEMANYHLTKYESWMVVICEILLLNI